MAVAVAVKWESVRMCMMVGGGSIQQRRLINRRGIHCCIAYYKGSRMDRIREWVER